MARGGSSPGERRGGRQAGTRNRRTDAAIARLDSLDYDAITELVGIAREAETCGDLQIRLTVAQTLARYSYPALKAIDLTVGGDTPMQLVIATGVPAAAEPVDSDALLERLSQAIDH